MNPLLHMGQIPVVRTYQHQLDVELVPGAKLFENFKSRDMVLVRPELCWVKKKRHSSGKLRQGLLKLIRRGRIEGKLRGWQRDHPDAFRMDAKKTFYFRRACPRAGDNKGGLAKGV